MLVSILKEIIMSTQMGIHPEVKYLFAHFLGLQVAHLLGGINGNVNCLVVTHSFSGHEFA